MYRKSYSSSLFLLWRKEVPSPLDLQRASGVISFVFVTLVSCWVKLRPYSEYIVILPKCYPSPLHMRLNVKVSNFFDYSLPCSSKFPQFYFFQFCYLGIFAQCTIIIVQVQQRYNKDPNTREQRSISLMVGWLLHCSIVRRTQSASRRKSAANPLQRAKYWILNEGSALGPIYKAQPRQWLPLGLPTFIHLPTKVRTLYSCRAIIHFSLNIKAKPRIGTNSMSMLRCLFFQKGFMACS